MIPVTQPAQDLNQRYNRTYVKYDDKVWYCRVEDPRDVTLPRGFKRPDHNVFLLYEPHRLDGEYKVVNPYKGVDSSSVKLGYVNVGGRAVYVKRPTSRQYRQGVSGQCIEKFLGSHAYTSCVNKMLQGIYPSVQEAVAQIQQGATSVAFNRYMKLAKRPKSRTRINVFFRDDLVGELDYANGDFSVVLEDDKMAWVMSPYLEDITWRLK